MSLYPKINLPTFSTAQVSKVDYLDAPQFDFSSGEFLFDNAGRIILSDGLKDWCLKVCMTERDTRLAYSDKIGVEMADLPQEKNYRRAKSQIIRTISEALLVNPRVQSVKNFSFRRAAEEVRLSFDVNDIQLEVSL